MRLTYFLLLFLLLMQVPTMASSHKVDSLYSVLKDIEEKGGNEALVKIHYDIAHLLASKSEEKYDKAIYHYDISAKLAMSHKDYSAAVTSIFGSGLSHRRKNNYPKSLEKFYRILEFEEGMIDELNKARAYTQISSIYQALGDYQKAFEYQLQGQLIFEVKEDSIGIANSHYNIGTIFFYQLQYEKALESYQKAKEICDALNKEYNIYSCLAALGAVNAKLGHHEESLDYNNRSLELAKKLNYRTGIAYAKGNIGSNFVTQKNYAKAEEFYKEAIQLKTELGDTYSAIGNKIEIAQLYLEWKKPQKTKTYLEEALQSANDLDSRSRRADIYKHLSLVYDQLNQPLVAYDYNKKYVAMKNSLLNEKTLEEMGQSKRRYELQKSEHEIQMLKKENELLEKNDEISKQKIYLFAITTFAIFMFLLWNWSKLKYQNRVNKLLEEKNLLLKSKSEEIQIKNKQLEESNKSLEQFAYVASHDLKEPLRMINSYTKLLKRKYSSSFDEAGNEFMHFIVDAVDRMETLLNDLLDFSRAGSQASPTEFIAVSDIMVIVASNLRHRLESLNATLIIRDKNLPLAKVHKTQLLQLLQNLVSNGVKFKGERDPIVEIDARPLKNGYVISVKDNGIGISKENLEKVFEMFRRLHTRDEYEGTGIGLATCKRIVSSWGGDIWVESEEGQGSTFYFSFPNSAVQLPASLALEAASEK